MESTSSASTASLDRTHLVPSQRPPEEDSRSSTVFDLNVGRQQENHVGEDVNSEFEHEAYGPPEGEKGVDPYEVRMGPEDSDNPKSWSRAYRWYITMLSATLLLNAYVAIPSLSS